MSCFRKMTNLINKVQERALTLTYEDNENNFQTLLNETNETYTSKNQKKQKTLPFLMTEIYKIKNNHAPPTRSTHYVSFIPVS